MSALKLRPYQEKFCDEVIRSAFSSRSVVAQAPTGMGKTICMSSIVARYIAKYPNQPVYICVHRIELVKQTAEKLVQIGIKPFLLVAGNKDIPTGYPVYVCMTETLNRRLDAIPVNPGLLIIDECHIGSHFKVITALKYYGAMIIGFTATPVSHKIRKKPDPAKPQPLNHYFNSIVIGPSIEQLITDGYLSGPATFALSGNIDKTKLKILGGDYSDSSQYEQLKKPKQLENTVSEYLHHAANGPKAIVFNCNVAHNNDVVAAFLARGLKAKAVTGETPSDERASILIWFKHTPDAILCNVGVATTGFDEPSVNMIILNFTTKSLAKYIQCIGRGSRVTPEKKTFTVIDMGDNSLEFGPFENAHDWKDIFYNPGRAGSGVAPTKVCINEKCGCLVHMSVTVCPYCGQLMPRTNIYDQINAAASFISSYKGPHVQIERLIEHSAANKHNKWAPLMKTVDSAVVQAKKLTDTITPEIENTIKQHVYPLAKIFYENTGQRFSSNQKGFVNKLITSKINALFL